VESAANAVDVITTEMANATATATASRMQMTEPLRAKCRLCPIGTLKHHLCNGIAFVHLPASDRLVGWAVRLPYNCISPARLKSFPTADMRNSPVLSIIRITRLRLAAYQPSSYLARSFMEHSRTTDSAKTNAIRLKNTPCHMHVTHHN